MKHILYVLFFIIMLLPNSLFGRGLGSNNPQIDINTTVSAYEGNSSTTSVQLTITASDCPDTKDIKIHWETAENGSATSGTDFQDLDGDVTFDAPSWSGTSCSPLTKTKNITVYINGDVVPEANETFLVKLSDGGTDSSQDFHFGDDHTTVTILNDDVATSNTPPIMDDISTQYIDVNKSYSFDLNPYITQTDGDPILSYNLSGTLPDGLSFDSSTGIISGTPTTNGRWTVSVSATDKDGVSNVDDFDMVVRASSGEAHSTADDLCYDWIHYEAKPEGLPPIGFCVDMFGIIKGGINCQQTISIRNRGNDSLTDVQAIIDTTGFSGSLLADCGIDETSGNCTEDNMFDMGPMGIFGNGVIYDPMPDYDANDSHTIYDKAKFAIAVFSGQNLYGSYTKGGESYVGEIHPCDEPVGDYMVGRIDGWDIFRDDSSNPPSDINLSTKIVNKPFKIAVGAFDEDRTVYQTLPGTGNIEFGIYEDGTTNLISNTDSFNASTASHKSESAELKVTKAVKVSRIGFKLCLTYERDTSDGHWIYELHPSTDCSGNAVACNVRTKNNTPQWHICYSTDKLTIRPKEFSIVEPSSFESDENIELLRAGKDYNFTVRAMDEDDHSALSYDQSKDNIDINATLLDATGQENSNLKGTLAFASNDFHFEDGNSTDDNGNHEVVGLSFDDVGNININIIDKDWASIDADDTPQDCAGGTVNGVYVPNGSYICGEQNATFIPHHFSVTNIHLRNHRDGSFTYLSNDLNMSAHLDVSLSAMNEQNNTTQNFRQGSKYYENPLTVDLNVTDWNSSATSRHPLGNAVSVHDIPDPLMLGFGGDDANGTHIIDWNTTIVSQRLMFNYERKNNQPVNPFMVFGTDVNISVASTYESNATGTTTSAIIKGNGVGDRNATFYFGRAKSSKFFYDNITESSVNTPISVVIYNGPGTTATFDTNVFKPTEEFDWYLATPHKTASNDGNITLGVSSGTISNADSVTIVNGVNSPAVSVSKPSGTLPATVDIDFTTTNPTDTSSWLIYNKDNNNTPSPFYKVRFIGTGSWTGEGQTGHVVGDDINNKKTQRVEW